MEKHTVAATLGVLFVRMTSMNPNFNFNFVKKIIIMNHGMCIVMILSVSFWDLWKCQVWAQGGQDIFGIRN